MCVCASKSLLRLLTRYYVYVCTYASAFVWCVCVCLRVLGCLFGYDLP